MPQVINYTDHIEIIPDVRFGKPVIISTRITVYDVLNWLASGMSHLQIIQDFPQIPEENIYACLAYAADNFK